MTATTAADLGSGHAGSVNRHFPCFDGLRAIAAILIVMHHSGFRVRRHVPLRMGRVRRPHGHRRADLLRPLGLPALPAVRGRAVRGHAADRHRRLLDSPRAPHLPGLLGGALPAGHPGRDRRAQPLRPARLHEPHADLLHALRDRCDHAVVEPRDRSELLRLPSLLGEVDAQARGHEHDQRAGDAPARLAGRARGALVRVAWIHLLGRPELEAPHLLLAPFADRAVLRRDGARGDLRVGRSPLGRARDGRRDRTSPCDLLDDRPRPLLVRVDAARPAARPVPRATHERCCARRSTDSSRSS